LHPISVIRRLNCYWSDFYPKKNPIFLYKNISLCVGWWPGNLYTANFFNLEINVNLVSYQNLWKFLLYLSISMHSDSDLIYFLFKFYVSILYLLQLMVLQSPGYENFVQKFFDFGLYGATLVNFCVFFYKKVGCQTIKFLWKMGVNQKIGVKSYLLVKSVTSYDSSACVLDSNFCVPNLYAMRITNCPEPLNHKLGCQPFHTPVTYLILT